MGLGQLNTVDTWDLASLVEGGWVGNILVLLHIKDAKVGWDFSIGWEDAELGVLSAISGASRESWATEMVYQGDVLCLFVVEGGKKGSGLDSKKYPFELIN